MKRRRQRPSAGPGQVRPCNCRWEDARWVGPSEFRSEYCGRPSREHFQKLPSPTQDGKVLNQGTVRASSLCWLMGCPERGCLFWKDRIWELQSDIIATKAMCRMDHVQNGVEKAVKQHKLHRKTSKRFTPRLYTLYEVYSNIVSLHILPGVLFFHPVDYTTEGFTENIPLAFGVATVLWYTAAKGCSCRAIFFPNFPLFFFPRKAGKAVTAGNISKFWNFNRGKIFGRLRIPISRFFFGKYGNIKIARNKIMKI